MDRGTERGWGVDRERQREGGVGWTGDRERVG